MIIDLFCGLGGWAEGFLAEGWEVIGFDVIQYAYPAQLVIQDVLTLTGKQFRGARLIVASPPCEEFSRWQMPWTRARNPKLPNPELWHAAERIAREAGVPLIIENVRCAQKFMGRARIHWGPFYLWGDVSGTPPPYQGHRKKESLSSSARAERAKIPFALSNWVARCL